MQELIKQLKALSAEVKQAIEQLNIAGDESSVRELEQQTARSDFWNDAELAGQVSQELAALRRRCEDWRRLQTQIDDALEIAVMADKEAAEDTALEAEVRQQFTQAEADFRAKQFELKLSGPYDKNSAIISIYAGTGGTDAQDWAEMLQRMYLRYAETAGFTATIVDQSPGEEAGIKSVTFEVNGRFAFGKLKGEKGVHRLVRLSPFNADNLRQTSFALVDVLPQLDRPDELEIDPKDLRIDVYRSGGHGGQSVNTTDSAVRITHLPTGTVVAIQNERSQLQNKEKAMAILKARLTALMLQQHKAELSEIRGAVQSAEWGSQIRSYVLHPYTKVKDHRTGHETSAATAVLDGQLDEFIDAYLSSQIGK